MSWYLLASSEYKQDKKVSFVAKQTSARHVKEALRTSLILLQHAEFSAACLACFATLWCHPQKIANSIKPFDNSIQGRHGRFFACKTAPGVATSRAYHCCHHILFLKIQARPMSHRCYLLGRPYHLMLCILLKDLTKMRFCINSCLKGGVM